MPEPTWIGFFVAFFIAEMARAVFRYIKNRKTKVVDEYTLSLGPSEEFPTVHLSLKLSTGETLGPCEFVPAYAYKLSDELCIASARATKKVTAGEGTHKDGQA